MKQWLVRQFPTFRRFYRWWRDHLTVHGKVLTLIVLVSLPALADMDAVWAIVFLASVLVLSVANFVSFLYRPRLAIRSTCPDDWHCNDTRSVTLQVTNIGRRPLYDLELALVPQEGVWDIVAPPWEVQAVAADATVSFRATVRARRRGLFQLPSLRATTFFPMHLVRRSRTIPTARHALILPAYHRLAAYQLAQSSPHITHGTTLTFQNIGLHGEYVGSREYQPGMPVRRWDYPSWARLGQPVVREFSDPQHPAVAVLVDTAFPAERRAGDAIIRELEAMLSLTAALTEALLERQHAIALLAVGAQPMRHPRQVLKIDHFHILEQLALGTACAETALRAMTLRLRKTPITWDVAIVISHHWEAAQERLFQAATRGRADGQRLVVDTQEPSTMVRSNRQFRHLSCAEIEAGPVEV